MISVPVVQNALAQIARALDAKLASPLGPWAEWGFRSEVLGGGGFQSVRTDVINEGKM